MGRSGPTVGSKMLTRGHCLIHRPSDRGLRRADTRPRICRAFSHAPMRTRTSTRLIPDQALKRIRAVCDVSVWLCSVVSVRRNGVIGRVGRGACCQECCHGESQRHDGSSLELEFIAGASDDPCEWWRPRVRGSSLRAVHHPLRTRTGRGRRLGGCRENAATGAVAALDDMTTRDARFPLHAV